MADNNNKKSIFSIFIHKSSKCSNNKIQVRATLVAIKLIVIDVYFESASVIQLLSDISRFTTEQSVALMENANENKT